MRAALEYGRFGILGMIIPAEKQGWINNQPNTLASNDCHGLSRPSKKII